MRLGGVKSLVGSSFGGRGMLPLTRGVLYACASADDDELYSEARERKKKKKERQAKWKMEKKRKNEN